MLQLFNVIEYDEELFTNLFDDTYKNKIKKICIKLDWLISNEYKMQNICAKIEDKLTRSLYISDVSCFV